jgi:REP element-mobilizing transposase RayT
MQARHRRSLRLREYDYSQPGAYFVTICVRNRECLLGEIAAEKIRLSHYGEIARQCWVDLPNHYAQLALDIFSVMPNHIHGIIMLSDVGAGLKPAPTRAMVTKHALPEIIRGFKTFSSRRVNKLRKISSKPLWQRSFYEHVIRDDESLRRIREYIATNPLRWDLDRENPQASGKDEFDNWLNTFKTRP